MPYFAPSQAQASFWANRLANRYYSAFVTKSTRSASGITAGLFALPFMCSGGVITSIAAHITAGAVNSNFRIGIYRNKPLSIYPGALAVDSNDISAAVLGVKEIATNITVSTGEIIWLVSVKNATFGANAVIQPSGNNQTFDVFGNNPASLQNAQAFNYSVPAFVYGALPTNFPDGANLTDNDLSSAIMVAVKYG